MNKLGNVFNSVTSGLLGSSAGAAPTAFQTLPDFAQSAYRDAVTRGQAASNNTSLFTPVAFNNDQQASFDLARQGYTDVTPETFNAALSTFTNPYEDQVVAKSLADLRSTGQGLLGDLGSGATAAGGFGGSRQAINESELIKNLSQQAIDSSASIRSGNYQSAAQNALAAIGLNNSNKAQYQSDLSAIGSQQQQQATNQQQAPLEAINYLLSVAKGVPYGGSGATPASSGLLGKIGENAGGIASLGALFSAFSDERLKDNINLVGERNGHNIYEFSYKSHPEELYRGVMAQEVQNIIPEAVSLEDGYLKVDYSKLGFPMERIK